MNQHQTSCHRTPGSLGSFFLKFGFTLFIGLFLCACTTKVQTSLHVPPSAQVLQNEQAELTAGPSDAPTLEQRPAPQKTAAESIHLQTDTDKVTAGEDSNTPTTPEEPATAEIKAESAVQPIRHKPAAPSPPATSHQVRAGENLYGIAAAKTTYSDGLLWPLIYKANRDQIKDPRQIYPGQQLIIPRDLSEQDYASARETARESGLFLH